MINGCYRKMHSCLWFTYHHIINLIYDKNMKSLAKHRYFFLVWRIWFLTVIFIFNIWSFQNFRNALKFRQMNYFMQCFKANITFADIFMSVFTCSKFIFAVIYMKYRNLSNFSKVALKSFTKSYPLSFTWHVSKHTLNLSLYFTPS